MEGRSVRNESTFRDANEQLRNSRERLAAPHERTPFLCECEDVRCTTLLLLTVEEYERARESGDCFLILPSTRAGPTASSSNARSTTSSFARAAEPASSPGASIRAQ